MSSHNGRPEPGRVRSVSSRCAARRARNSENCAGGEIEDVRGHVERQGSAQIRADRVGDTFPEIGLGVPEFAEDPQAGEPDLRDRGRRGGGGTASGRCPGRRARRRRLAGSDAVVQPRGQSWPSGHSCPFSRASAVSRAPVRSTAGWMRCTRPPNTHRWNDTVLPKRAFQNQASMAKVASAKDTPLLKRVPSPPSSHVWYSPVSSAIGQSGSSSLSSSHATVRRFSMSSQASSSSSRPSSPRPNQAMLWKRAREKSASARNLARPKSAARLKRAPAKEASPSKTERWNSAWSPKRGRRRRRRRGSGCR